MDPGHIEEGAGMEGIFRGYHGKTCYLIESTCLLGLTAILPEPPHRQQNPREIASASVQSRDFPCPVATPSLSFPRFPQARLLERKRHHGEQLRPALAREFAMLEQRSIGDQRHLSRADPAARGRAPGGDGAVRLAGA